MKKCIPKISGLGEVTNEVSQGLTLRLILVENLNMLMLYSWEALSRQDDSDVIGEK